MTDDMQRVVAHLASKDVGFYVQHDQPGGKRTVHIDAKDVPSYAADPVGFLARHYGVSREDYLGWHQSEHRVLCSGRTKKGNPCKATTPRFGAVGNPKIWAEHQGGHCNQHG